MSDDVSASAGWCDAPKATARAEHDAARCRRSQQHIPKSKQQRHRWIEVFRVPLPQILRVERRQSEPTSSWFQWFTGRDDVLWCDLSRIFSLTQPLRMPTSCDGQIELHRVHRDVIYVNENSGSSGDLNVWILKLNFKISALCRYNSDLVCRICTVSYVDRTLRNRSFSRTSPILERYGGRVKEFGVRGLLALVLST